MAKFHINSKGVPAPCKAKEGNCPFGGEDLHYDNVEDAQVGANNKNQKAHDFLPTLIQEKPEVKLKGTDLYVDGRYIGDLSVSDYKEREQIISDYGLYEYMNEIMEL